LQIPKIEIICKQNYFLSIIYNNHNEIYILVFSISYHWPLLFNVLKYRRYIQVQIWHGSKQKYQRQYQIHKSMDMVSCCPISQTIYSILNMFYFQCMFQCIMYSLMNDFQSFLKHIILLTSGIPVSWSLTTW
jgi:hypothetical protein